MVCLRGRCGGWVCSRGQGELCALCGGTDRHGGRARHNRNGERARHNGNGERARCDRNATSSRGMAGMGKKRISYSRAGADELGLAPALAAAVEGRALAELERSQRMYHAVHERVAVGQNGAAAHDVELTELAVGRASVDAFLRRCHTQRAGAAFCEGDGAPAIARAARHRQHRCRWNTAPRGWHGDLTVGGRRAGGHTEDLLAFALNGQALGCRANAMLVPDRFRQRAVPDEVGLHNDYEGGVGVG